MLCQPTLEHGNFHTDPFRESLLKSLDGKLSVIDFGMMADVAEEDRHNLIGLAVGLPLVTKKSWG